MNSDRRGPTTGLLASIEAVERLGRAADRAFYASADTIETLRRIEDPPAAAQPVGSFLGGRRSTHEDILRRTGAAAPQVAEQVEEALASEQERA